MSKHTLNGSRKKSVTTSGFRARCSTRSGRNVLKRRRKKQRWKLATVVSAYKHQITNGKNMNGPKKGKKKLAIRARKKYVPPVKPLTETQEKNKKAREQRTIDVINAIAKNKTVSQNQRRRDVAAEKRKAEKRAKREVQKKHLQPKKRLTRKTKNSEEEQTIQSQATST